MTDSKQALAFIHHLPADLNAIDASSTARFRILSPLPRSASPGLDELPAGTVVGSNLIAFDDAVGSDIRAAVCLSLLTAQRVASRDPAIQTPQSWLDKHMDVLQRLTWALESQGTVQKKFDDVNLELHQAIIPFLQAAFGPAVAVSSLIITALQQLCAAQQNQPWFQLFASESRRFSVTEYQFTTVQSDESGVRMKLAAARLEGHADYKQILFVKVQEASAKFDLVEAGLAISEEQVRLIGPPLREKMSSGAAYFIAELPDDLISQKE